MWLVQRMSADTERTRVEVHWLRLSAHILRCHAMLAIGMRRVIVLHMRVMAQLRAQQLTHACEADRWHRIRQRLVCVARRHRRCVGQGVPFVLPDVASVASMPLPAMLMYPRGSSTFVPREASLPSAPIIIERRDGTTSRSRAVAIERWLLAFLKFREHTHSGKWNGKVHVDHTAAEGAVPLISVDFGFRADPKAGAVNKFHLLCSPVPSPLYKAATDHKVTKAIDLRESITLCEMDDAVDLLVYSMGEAGRTVVALLRTDVMRLVLEAGKTGPIGLADIRCVTLLAARRIMELAPTQLFNTFTSTTRAALARWTQKVQRPRSRLRVAAPRSRLRVAAPRSRLRVAASA